jgi:tetratricopeptide (TPR) repeat protein
VPKRTRSKRPSRRSREPFSALGTLLLWALILLVPVVIAPTAANTFRLPKLMLAEWLGLASLLGLALGAVFGRRRPAQLPAPWWSRALVACAPVAVVVTLGLAVTDHPEHVRQALADLWIGIACLVGWSLALPSRTLERALAGFAIPGALLAGLGILQFHGIYRPFAFTGGEEADRLGVSSLAGNTGDLAAFLVLPALVAQWRVAEAGARRRDRVLWAAVLVLCCYGVAVTQTLTALAALLAGSALLWSLRLPWRKAVASLGALAVAAVVLLLVVAPVRQRLDRVVDRVTEGRLGSALSGRLDGWKAALWMVAEHPVLGVGHGAYRAEFVPAKLALLERGAKLYGHQRDPFFANAHNELLEVGAEWGVLGWIALAWALWMLVLAALRGMGEGPASRRGFALGALASFAVLSVGQFPFRLAIAAYPALVLMAWIFRTADEEAPAPGGAPDEEASRPDRGRLASRVGGRLGVRLGAGGLAAVLAVALVGQTGRWIDRVGASKRLRVVEAMTARATAAAGQVPPEVIRGNVRLLQRARELDPSDVAAPSGLAAQYLLSGNAARAEELYLEALALEPRPELYLNLGRARLATGEREAAIEVLRVAVRLNPSLRSEIPRTIKREVKP